jgi:hypothetical protein
MCATVNKDTQPTVPPDSDRTQQDHSNPRSTSFPRQETYEKIIQLASSLLPHTDQHKLTTHHNTDTVGAAFSFLCAVQAKLGEQLFQHNLIEHMTKVTEPKVLTDIRALSHASRTNVNCVCWMLRDHKTKKPIPCTCTSAAGTKRKRENTIDMTINRQKLKIDEKQQSAVYVTPWNIAKKEPKIVPPAAFP